MKRFKGKQGNLREEIIVDEDKKRKRTNEPSLVNYV